MTIPESVFEFLLPISWIVIPLGFLLFISAQIFLVYLACTGFAPLLAIILQFSLYRLLFKF